jgi:thioredoxin 1
MADGVVEVTEATFEAEVLKSETPVLVDFWAAWCGPCRMIGPIVEELATEYAGKLKIAKVNVDNSQNVAVTFGIHSIPTLIFFKDGKEVNRIIGAVSKESLKSTVEENL